MSLLDSLFGLLTSDTENAKSVEHPCSNCPGNCTIAPEACQVCSPYKEKIIDAIYKVNHKEEILSQYEVIGVHASAGTVTCPFCGGNSENHYVCDYCGSTLKEGNGKIQVSSASKIPNPVLDAQDLIFERYETVKSYVKSDSGYGLEEALSGIESQGLFSTIFSALLGNDKTLDSDSIGNKMTETEIGEMAKYYGVSEADYLQGLDNGKYLTLSFKSTCAKAEARYLESETVYKKTGGLTGSAGMAGALTLGSLLFGGHTYNKTMASKGASNRNASRYRMPQPSGERVNRTPFLEHPDPRQIKGNNHQTGNIMHRPGQKRAPEFEPGMNQHGMIPPHNNTETIRNNHPVWDNQERFEKNGKKVGSSDPFGGQRNFGRPGGPGGTGRPGGQGGGGRPDVHGRNGEPGRR